MKGFDLFGKNGYGEIPIPLSSLHLIQVEATLNMRVTLGYTSHHLD
jgi:hypothetical protein